MKTFTFKSNLGFFVLYFGTVLILLWEGILKFTPTEAAGIEKLIKHHPTTFWMYDYFSIQAVSNFMGVFELTVVVLLLLSLKFNFLYKIAGLGLCMIFAMTLSYLFTTPGMFKLMDGIPATNFFLVKDIMYLGFGILLLTKED